LNITPLYLGGPFFCGHTVYQNTEIYKDIDIFNFKKYQYFPSLNRALSFPGRR